MQKKESIQIEQITELSNETLLLTVKDVQQALQLGKNAAYRLMNSKTFPTIYIGGKLFVGRVQLLEWIANQSGRHVLI